MATGAGRPRLATLWPRPCSVLDPPPSHGGRRDPHVFRHAGPVVRHADRLDLPGLAEQMATVTDAPRVLESTRSCGDGSTALRSIVGHDPAHGAALAGEPDYGPSQEAGAAVAGLVVQHLDIGGPEWSSMQTWTYSKPTEIAAPTSSRGGRVAMRPQAGRAPAARALATRADRLSRSIGLCPIPGPAGSPYVRSR